jgi:primosomal protein N'
MVLDILHGMYLDIIPSEHSIGIHPLTYSVPGDLVWDITPGCLVEIPMRHEKEYGVVVGRRETAPVDMEIRDIVRIVSEEPLLASYQIALILEISAKYLIPIHRVLSFFVSKWVLKRLEKKNFEQLVPQPYSHPTISPSNHLTILKDSIITGDILKKFLKPSTVVICPDDITLYRLGEELSGMDIFFLPGEATDTKKAQSWIDIRNRKYDIIIWNRKILYYNLSAYTDIIYLEDAFGREYFHYPIRIEYIDIFDMVDKQSRFVLHILTSAPRLTTLARFRHFHLQNL